MKIERIAREDALICSRAVKLPAAYMAAAAAMETEEDREHGEFQEESIDSLQESLKRKRMKTERDRSEEKIEKSTGIFCKPDFGSRSASITSSQSEYIHVRLREDNEDIGVVRARSLPQWQQEASFHARNEESQQIYVKACSWTDEVRFTGENPLLFALKNEHLEKQDNFQSSRDLTSARETVTTQFVVKNGDYQKDDDFQSSKPSTWLSDALQSRSVRNDALRPSKSCRQSEETSLLAPPSHVEDHTLQEENVFQASKSSRWSEGISFSTEKPSLICVNNHGVHKKENLKVSKASRWSENDSPREEKFSSSHMKNQELSKTEDIQASKASRWSVDSSPSEEKPLSLHLKSKSLQRKDDFQASEASRRSMEISRSHKISSSFRVKDQDLQFKRHVEASKASSASRWSEVASPSGKNLSTSHVNNRGVQKEDDLKPSKSSRWSEESSSSEENVSSSHVNAHFPWKKGDLQTVKSSRWSEEPSPREEKPSSFHPKKADFEASKASRWVEEASPSVDKAFLFGIENEDLKKKDAFDAKSELSTDDEEEGDQLNEYVNIKSDLGIINGGVRSLLSKIDSSPLLESQICLIQGKNLAMVRSSQWKEEISLYEERASLFSVQNQNIQQKDEFEAKIEHENNDEESHEHVKVETDLGEISPVNEREVNQVEGFRYQKDIDLNSSRHGSEKGSLGDNEDEEVISFLPEEINSAGYKIDMLKGCRSVEEFEMVKKINEGTYGVVYKAKDKKTGEIVALKKVKMEKERDGFPMTSLREINILLSIKHPCIVNVKEVVVGNSMDSIYMVMEYMEHDLKRLMGTLAHPFSQREVKCLMLKLLEGIKHLHDNWVLHRDLKTSNILLNNQGELKICDFGLARQYGSPLKTYTSLVVTLWYRSPELLLGCKEYSTAVDMWSLGCIMAELLSKEPLFCGKNELDQVDKIFRTLGTPDETVWPDFPNLPGVKCSFVKQRFNRLREKFPPTAFAGGVTLSNKGFDLLSRLLMYDPKKRITSEDALNHEWFNEFPLPKMPELSSSKRAGVSTW